MHRKDTARSKKSERLVLVGWLDVIAPFTLYVLVPSKFY